MLDVNVKTYEGLVTPAEIDERVAAGAEWLDRHMPGWVKEIDLDSLDLANQCACVLGQLIQTVEPVIGENLNYYTAATSGSNDVVTDPDDITPTERRALSIAFGQTQRLSVDEAIAYGFHGRLARYVDDVDDVEERDLDDEYTEWKALTNTGDV